MSKTKDNGKKITYNAEREQALVTLLSQMGARSQLADKLGQSFGTDRDTYKTFGYPKKNVLDFGDFWNLFKRGDIASRIINAPVEASWRLRPTIEEIGNDNTERTVFEKEWDDLVREKKLFHYLVRADRLSGIGKLGVLFLGFDDGLEPREEVTGKNKLIYLRPFKEDNICIKTWDNDPASERFGLPVIYQLTNFSTGNAPKSVDILVHHSRVLHLAEGLLEDDVEGLPRLEKVYNRFLDFEKVMGSTGEAFYRGACQSLAFTTAKDAKLDTSTTAVTTLEDQIEKLIHNWQKYIILEGMEVQPIAPQVSDPSSAFDVIVSIIAASEGIPKRILIGSERGELASSQDETAWAKKNDERRKNYCEPFILRELIKKLVFAGVLTEPIQGYEVSWPDMIIPTDKEKAEVAKIRTEAIAAYSNAVGAAMIVPEDVFLKKIMEFDSEEIEEITKKVQGELDDEEKDAEIDAKIREELKKEMEIEEREKVDIARKAQEEIQKNI